MFENESDYFEALGLEAPTEDGQEEHAGENEPEAAEPAAEEDSQEPVPSEDEPDEGGQEREPADPADGAEEERPGELTREERAQNAARRREAEREEYARQAVERAMQQRDARERELFERAGFSSGDQKITSMDELQSYLDRQRAEQLTQDLQAGRLTADGLRSVVAQELDRQTQQERQAQAQRQAQADREAFRQQVEREIAEIGKYDPAVKTVADLQKLDRASAFEDAVRNHGYGFLDAYRFVYADKIAAAQMRQEQRREAQRSQQSVRSKDHLRPMKTQGSGDVTVPAEVERNIRAIMPKATPKEIRDFYRKDSKKFE